MYITTLEALLNILSNKCVRNVYLVIVYSNVYLVTGVRNAKLHLKLQIFYIEHIKYIHFCYHCTVCLKIKFKG